MSEKTITRTNLFRWHSKYDLYNYFQKHYSLDRDSIDHEILHAMQTFYPRRGQAIKTMELWQKVGLNLEKKHGANTTPIVIDVDMGIMDTTTVNDCDPNGTRRMGAIPENGKYVSDWFLTDMVFRKKLN